MRNRTQRNRSVPTQGLKSVTALVPSGPASQRVGPRPARPRLSLPRQPLSRLSEAGLAFLKCAFASPDFSVDPGKGIPDQFHGRTLAIKDCNTTSIAFTPDTDTYLIIAPVPGYAYFKAEVPIGVNPGTFIGTTFPTFSTNFGSGDVGVNNFSKFRYASSAVGLYPTSNLMQFSGSVQMWRVDLNLIETLQSAVTAVGPPVITRDTFVNLGVAGLAGIRSLAPRDNYSESFIRGGYTFAFDKSQDFEWQNFVSASSFSDEPGSSTPPRHLGQETGHRLTGMGNVNTIVIKVSTPPGAVNTGILRVWNCIELQPNTNSSLFQFSGVSPPHDVLALELYHQLKMRFPVAMPAAENSRFWETVLRILQQVTAVGSLMPGPVGVISGGANTITNAIAGLVM